MTSGVKRCGIGAAVVVAGTVGQGVVRMRMGMRIMIILLLLVTPTKSHLLYLTLVESPREASSP